MTTKNGYKQVTLNIPNNFKVMDDGEFLKLRELIKAGLEMIDSIGDHSADDKTAELLWPVLRFATDLLNEYPETIDVLGEVANYGANSPKRWGSPTENPIS